MKPTGSAGRKFGLNTSGSLRMGKKMNEFVVCVRNEGYEAALELRKIYQIIPDSSAERHELDESHRRVG
jgi:hypothetical protein